ncbi:hypothetical protein [Pseudomonas fluorescens]|uniref:hypothetical protein n=1 Tax=Pseudomonas fluorescens TaxID=294 RepID=UPI003D200D8D
MDELDRVFCRDLIALPLAMNDFIIRRDAWMGDGYVDLDVEKFEGGKSIRYLIKVQGAEGKLVASQKMLKEVAGFKKKYGIDGFLAIVKLDGSAISIDSELRSLGAFEFSGFKVFDLQRNRDFGNDFLHS